MLTAFKLISLTLLLRCFLFYLGIAGWESTIHLRGEATAVHSGECGIVADQNCKVFIHLPAGHDTCFNNGWGDRVTSRGGFITNVSA